MKTNKTTHVSKGNLLNHGTDSALPHGGRPGGRHSCQTWKRLCRSQRWPLRSFSGAPMCFVNSNSNQILSGSFQFPFHPRSILAAQKDPSSAPTVTEARGEGPTTAPRFLPPPPRIHQVSPSYCANYEPGHGHSPSLQGCVPPPQCVPGTTHRTKRDVCCVFSVLICPQCERLTTH